MRKTWVITILTVLLLSGRAFAGDSVKPDTAPTWGNFGDATPKAVVMTDTQLRQKALAEVTLTDTWLKENGYTRENKEEVMKLQRIYEKDGLYYSRVNNRMIHPDKIANTEDGIKFAMEVLRNRRNRAK